MKNFIKANVIFISIFLMIIPKLIVSQNLSDKTILFDQEHLNIHKQIFYSNNWLDFRLDNSSITKISVNQTNFHFFEGIDGKSFGVANYYFGKKSEKSWLEIYLLDDNFKVTFYKKLTFSYEEQFPKILQISSNEVALLFPALGELKIFRLNLEKTFNLVKEGEDKLFKERIGHLKFLNNHLVVFLSQIKKSNDYFSKIFLIDFKNFEVNEFELNIDILYKVFEFNSDIYFSGIEIDPTFQFGFYLLELNRDNLTESKVLKISDELIEGQVSNRHEVLFSKDSFYKLSKNKLEKLDIKFLDEIIINAYSVGSKIFVITRKELKNNLYEMNFNFEVLNKETIDQFLSNPELKIVSVNNLFVIDKNKIVLEKNISEE